MILALLAKELLHHFKVMFGALLLTAAALLLGLLFFINQEAPSLMRTAGATVQWISPMLAALIARRLFVIEHRQRTFELLSMLPISPLKLTAAKLIFGGAVLAVIISSLIFGTAAIVARRELIANDWLFKMNLQALSYSLAWFGVASAFAHLGKHRLVAWSALFILLTTLDEVSPQLTKTLFWLGPLAEPFDRTRYATPWSAVVTATLWGAAGVACALSLSAHRGGLLVQRWYTRMTGEERGLAAALISFALLGSELIATEVTPVLTPSGGLSLLPKVGTGPVRAAADEGSALWSLASRLDVELLAIGTELDINTWPVVAVTLQTGPKKLPVVASGDHRSMILRVDPKASEQSILRSSIREVLAGRANYLPFWNERQAWISKGFAETWLRTRGTFSPGFELRAAWAANRVDEEMLNVWSSVELEVGEDVAEAIAWVGLQTARESCGEKCVRALAKRLLSVHRPQRGLSVLMQRAQGGHAPIEAITNISWFEFRKRWRGQLLALRASHQEQLAQLEELGLSLSPHITRGETEDSAVSLFWTPDPHLQSYEIWWATTSQLAAYPIPRGRVHREPIELSRAYLPIPIDPRSRLVAAFALKVPEMDGWAVLKWRELQ